MAVLPENRRMPTATPTLPESLDALERMYGPQPAPALRDPLELLLFEEIGYLLEDDRKNAAFAALKQKVGTRAERILGATAPTLLSIAKLAGPQPEERVERLKKTATLALDHARELRALAALPLATAKRVLGKFPGVGEPGAEKVLLFSHSQAVLALDPNAVRVLGRLGYGTETKNYAATYRSVQHAAAAQLTPSFDGFVRAFQLLRTHGLETCLRESPRCEVCPLKMTCAYFKS